MSQSGTKYGFVIDANKGNINPGITTGAFKKGTKSIGYGMYNTYSWTDTCPLLFDASGVVPTAAENRPYNIAMIPLICY